MGVWNAATALGLSGTVGPHLPTGTAQLARLLRFHNAGMGDGLGFALEVTPADQLEAVASAADHLDLVDVARLVRRPAAGGRDVDLAEGLNDTCLEASGKTGSATARSNALRLLGSIRWQHETTWVSQAPSSLFGAAAFGGRVGPDDRLDIGR